jgi:hypothetical protein
MGKRDRIEKTRTRRGPPVLRPLKPRGQRQVREKPAKPPSSDEVTGTVVTTVERNGE